MAFWRCPEGHTVKLPMQPSRGEKVCPEHRCDLRPPAKKSSGGFGSESAAEKQARQRFNRIVTERPCFFLDTDEAGQPRRPDHVCTYPLDAHHLLPKSYLRTLDLDEDELLELMYDPILGAPLCRFGHNAVEACADRIYFDELDPDLILRCERFDAEHDDCPSLLARLHIESPERTVA